MTTPMAGMEPVAIVRPGVKQDESHKNSADPRAGLGSLCTKQWQKEKVGKGAGEIPAVGPGSRHSLIC